VGFCRALSLVEMHPAFNAPLGKTSSSACAFAKSRLPATGKNRDDQRTKECEVT
jgi:hypothetical protein